uniref:Cell division cycle 5related protein putative n=1 Tax=Albugo laibachii Nc14 TaxID=890382 RepID=F0W167_9STRA|nr:cell division cycle 5related protein putative [Albugo laibachii Nc14]|eukprot:CCA14792.1 cell division cycle 5related protein putative [Albugo laibachii Nc14]
MQIMIKGGVWKNTEDEILKAAVMKYGKNQWARVASLLSRKSAKQCKARWYEWLDPSIKKTEWSREEEEKLLHLAKLMPSQWRTIAPIVGRTAAQCMEHYEHLLDAAQQKEGIQLSEDPRRLRPGEIDPNPENKPARPDPVDMDEDEKEMLSEARARLANTKGKKAKRKAREKQLEEARRLASLQKRRELKAAGIASISRLDALRRKRKFIDYAREIPFYKQIPAGFHDTTEEQMSARNNRALNPKEAAKHLSQMEMSRRDQQERKERRQDAKRQKSLMKSNLPQVLAAVNERNDPINSIKRKPLTLPKPVVSNEELTEMAKLGMQASHAASLALESQNETRALVGNYDPTPLSLQTPAERSEARGKSTQDMVMQEAANLAAMTRASTPLLGGENIVLQDGTGYAGVTPLRTPTSVQRSVLSTRTPLRDELGINPEQLEGMGTDSRAERMRLKVTKKELHTGFSDLPTPQNEYEINIPQLKVGKDDKEPSVMEQDAGEMDAQMRKRQDRLRELEFQRQSQAVQRDLPRPNKLKRELVNQDLKAVELEMYQMISNDIIQHPMQESLEGKKHSKKKRGQLIDTQEISEEDLAEARKLIQLETTLGHFEDVWKANDTTSTNQIWNDQQLRQLRRDDKQDCGIQFAFAETEEDCVRALKAEWKDLRDFESGLAKRSQKLKERLHILRAGLMQRACTAQKALNETIAQIEIAVMERSCFEHLAALETQGLATRLTRLANDVNQQQLRELALQKQYGSLA